MKYLLQFSLSGRFAHFNFPYTSPNHLKKSYSIPPRTTILGILGSMIGLKGFADYNQEFPEYYEKLMSVPVSICLNKIPEKQLIKYNSLNSFADNSENGNNVIIAEEILLNPNYEILLILNDSIEEQKNLLDKLKNNPKSQFPIYFGKNEFFAVISNINLYSEDSFEDEDIYFEEVEKTNKLKSIVPKDYSSESQIENPEEVLGNSVLDSFSYDVEFNEKKLKTKQSEVIYFIEGEKQRSKLKFKDNVSLLNLKGNHYFFFNNESIKYLRERSKIL